MNILLTNDDGIESEGILVLARRLQENGNKVTVLAPARNQSAKSHSITMREVQRLEQLSAYHGAERYAFDGTPVDCVEFALRHLRLQPDLLISGINDGMNLGSDVIYSGTVGAAMEGTFQGIPSIAVSTFRAGESHCTAEDFAFAAERLVTGLERYCAYLRPQVTLNVNVPVAEKFCGREIVCAVGRSEYNMYYTREEGGYRLRGIPVELPEADTACDLYYAKQGYITLSPLQMNFTDYTALAEWKKE